MNEVLVRLDVDEWQRVLQILSTASWQTANPLIMKIGEQLRQSVEMAAKREGAIRSNGEDRPAPQ